jgi:hypothetical protein
MRFLSGLSTSRNIPTNYFLYFIQVDRWRLRDCGLDKYSYRSRGDIRGRSYIPESGFVTILASFCVWTKSLICKDAVNRDSTCQNIFRRIYTAKKIEDFRFPVSCPDDVLSRPDAHLSTAPFVRTTCHTVQTPDRPASSVRTTYLSVRTLHCIEKLLLQLASVRTSQHPVRTSISDRSASDSFQVQNIGRLTHRSDDVVSRSDALINMARIAIQISSSGRQSAMIRMRAHQLRKLPIRLQSSGRLPLMVRTHA